MKFLKAILKKVDRLFVLGNISRGYFIPQEGFPYLKMLFHTSKGYSKKV
jgi:hypothetical protein